MDRTSFMAMLDYEHKNIVALNQTKGKEYTPDSDVTENFKRHGTTLDVPPEIVWAIYAGKHWDAIEQYCRRGEVSSDEPIYKRIRDLILYLYLLLAMVNDKVEGEKVGSE
jgi:hypothetical protein